MDESEVSLVRQLDILTKPLTNLSSYPLLPTRFGEGSPEADGACMRDAVSMRGGNDAASLSAVDNLAASSAMIRHIDVAEEDETHRAARWSTAVRGECERRVDGLSQWMSRVNEGLTGADECLNVLQQLLLHVTSMSEVTRSVQEQSDHLHGSASVLAVRKAKLEMVRDELKRTVEHFTHVEDICHEAEDPMLSSTSERFPGLFQELEEEMQYLSRNAQYKSAKEYAMRLAAARQRAAFCLKDAVMASFKRAQKETVSSSEYQKALHPLPPPSAYTAEAKLTPVAQVFDSELLCTPSGRLEPSVAGTEDGPQAVGHLTLSGSLTASHVINKPPFCMAPTIRDSSVDPADSSFDMAQSFAMCLRETNRIFLQHINANTLLRRVVEMRHSFTYTGAGAFGEAHTDSIAGDANLQDIFAAYREARVLVVGPLLRVWSRAWRRLDTHSESSLVSLSRTSGDASNMMLSGDSLPQLTLHMCALLEISLVTERSLLDEVWIREDFSTLLFPTIVSQVAEEAYHVFRAHLVRVDDMEALAQAVANIQSASLHSCVDGVREASDLWVRMIQDVQERIIFRISVSLRRDIPECRPTKGVAQQYLRLGNVEGAQASAEMDGASEMFFLPGVLKAVQLLRQLYFSLEFAAFSVFAQEAIHAALALIAELAKLMASSQGESWATSKSLMCQLAHVLYLRDELSHIDANITVVENSLDLSKLRERRLEIVQHSRESKEGLEKEVGACKERLVQNLKTEVVAPLSGASRKSPDEVSRLVGEVQKRKVVIERLLTSFIRDAAVVSEVMQGVDRYVEEMVDEVRPAGRASSSKQEAAVKGTSAA